MFSKCFFKNYTSIIGFYGQYSDLIKKMYFVLLSIITQTAASLKNGLLSNDSNHYIVLITYRKTSQNDDSKINVFSNKQTKNPLSKPLYLQLFSCLQIKHIHPAANTEYEAVVDLLASWTSVAAGCT